MRTNIVGTNWAWVTRCCLDQGQRLSSDRTAPSRRPCPEPLGAPSTRPAVRRGTAAPGRGRRRRPAARGLQERHGAGGSLAERRQRQRALDALRATGRAGGVQQEVALHLVTDRRRGLARRQRSRSVPMPSRSPSEQEADPDLRHRVDREGLPGDGRQRGRRHDDRRPAVVGDVRRLIGREVRVDRRVVEPGPLRPPRRPRGTGGGSRRRSPASRSAPIRRARSRLARRFDAASSSPNVVCTGPSGP